MTLSNSLPRLASIKGYKSTAHLICMPISSHENSVNSAGNSVTSIQCNNFIHSSCGIKLTGCLLNVLLNCCLSLMSGRTPQAPQYSYVLAPQDLNPGDSIKSGSGVPIKPGNVLPLKDIPVGMPINCIELKPDMGGVLCRCGLGFYQGFY